MSWRHFFTCLATEVGKTELEPQHHPVAEIIALVLRSFVGRLLAANPLSSDKTFPSKKMTLAAKTKCPGLADGSETL